jgi:hypothetical protein
VLEEEAVRPVRLARDRGRHDPVSARAALTWAGDEDSGQALPGAGNGVRRPRLLSGGDQVVYLDRGSFFAPNDPKTDPDAIDPALFEVKWLGRRWNRHCRLPGQHGEDDRVRLRRAPFHDFRDAAGIVGYPADLGAIKARPQEQGSFEVERLRS